MRACVHRMLVCCKEKPPTTPSPSAASPLPDGENSQEVTPTHSDRWSGHANTCAGGELIDIVPDRRGWCVQRLQVRAGAGPRTDSHCQLRACSRPRSSPSPAAAASGCVRAHGTDRAAREVRVHAGGGRRRSQADADASACAEIRY